MSSSARYTDGCAGGRMLPVVEEFYTLQGEGFHSGRAAYFIRLAGCDNGCPWCDAKYTWDVRRFEPVAVEELAARAAATPARTVVITGGEPLRWELGPLTEALQAAGCECLLETAGTHALSGRFDWICLSPKRHRPPVDSVWQQADELKVVVAGEEDLAWADECAARVRPDCRLYLQPEWNCAAAVMPLVTGRIKADPRWRVSIQSHKYMQIP